MAITGRAIDHYAFIHHALASVVDVVHCVCQVTEVAAAIVVLPILVPGAPAPGARSLYGVFAISGRT